jgi:hypothetical protein
LQPITIDAHPTGNPWLNYSVYLNNVLLAGYIAIDYPDVYRIGFRFEIKAGNGPKLMSMGDNSIMKVMIGKLLPYTIIYSGDSVIIYGSPLLHQSISIA